ncbi:hypothetical protein E4U16_005518 [Claviceps sp. LM84 group G4]|nr:hypothetical protein E4U16_005518 [Claviceps sp. LM84 group G4]
MPPGPTAYTAYTVTHCHVGAKPEDLETGWNQNSLLRFGDRYRVTLAMAGRGQSANVTPV